jgi:sulfate permease, SulP family
VIGHQVIGLGTATLGAAMVVLGRLKLARLVSYLPMPVVGGQIVFIAFFCFRAGLALCVGQALDTVPAWLGMATDEVRARSLLAGL